MPRAKKPRTTPRDAPSPLPSGLPPASDLLAVCAHPDDESFGLGALLAAYAASGTRVRVLCLTCGEASTLGAGDQPLAVVRAAELEAAARVLGVAEATLLAHPDGALARVPLDELAESVDRAAKGADLVLTFDDTGVTGHADHRAATGAALRVAAARRLPVLGWTVPAGVAEALNAEYGGAFVGRRPDEVDVEVCVERRTQLAAISCHESQSRSNPVLWRRLELSGERECLRYLFRPAP